MSNDNQCVFEHQRERCTMPRVYCDTPMGTRGFCHHHRPEENRDHGMEQDLFFNSILSTPQTRREWLKDQYPTHPSVIVARHAERMTEWHRQPGESREDYRRRAGQTAIRVAKGTDPTTPKSRQLMCDLWNAAMDNGELAKGRRWTVEDWDAKAGMKRAPPADPVDRPADAEWFREYSENVAQHR